jgi:membrane fusion protein (multidrug efflux system)
MKALTLSALAATLLAGCGDATAETTSDPAAVTVPAAPETRVEAARIEPSAAALDLMLPGEVSGSKDARLASANGGYVEKVLVKRGQSVRAGQALAYIDTRTHRAQREQAQAQHDLAVSEAGRLDKLGDHATASQKAQASTQVAVTKAALDMAEARAARAVVTAPFPGVIGQVAVEEGEVLGPGSPVARLVQLDPVHVTVSVSDRDVGALRVGQRVRVSTDAVPRIFDGDLVAIDPAADLNTRTFLAEIAVPNPDGRLLPGMIASARLSTQVVEGSVVLPQDWLVTRMDGVGVFLVEDGVARWRPVVPGTVVHDQVVISSGLAPGDLVVSTGHRGLADGDPLIVSRQGVCCTHGRATW